MVIILRSFSTLSCFINVHFPRTEYHLPEYDLLAKSTIFKLRPWFAMTYFLRKSLRKLSMQSDTTSFKAMFFSLFMASFFGQGTSIGQVIFAINAGGESHTDSFGIKYERDPLMGKVGTASDFGKQLMIGRVPQNDQILYQTERYHHSTFGYDIPVEEDGDFVLVLKFSEVYFNAPNMKVFDVVLNGDHTIVTDLDIFDQVGRGVAHDEYVPFSVVKGRLIYGKEESDIRGGKIRVEFIKGYRDNPKINAIYVVKGSLDDVPKLLPMPAEPEIDDFKDEVEEKKQTKSRRPSGPKTPDPYKEDDSTVMLPVFVVIGAFIPILFCLCKL